MSLQNKTQYDCIDSRGNLRRGFSLVEIMVSVALIGIIIAVTLVAMGGGKDSTAAKAGSREIAAAVRLAQSSAIAGHVVSSGRIPCTFRFATSADGTRYLVQYTYHAEGAACGGGLQTLLDQKLPAGAIASPGMAIDFTVPFGLRAASTTAIRVQRGSGSSMVCISPIGRVTEQSGTSC